MRIKRAHYAVDKDWILIQKRKQMDALCERIRNAFYTKLANNPAGAFFWLTEKKKLLIYSETWNEQLDRCIKDLYHAI